MAKSLVFVRARDDGMTFVTLQILHDKELVPIEVPSALSWGYAAMRVAEVLGYDPLDGPWLLFDWEEKVFVSDDQRAAVGDSVTVLLGRTLALARRQDAR